MKFIHAHERRGIDPNNSFTPLRFIGVLVPTQNRERPGIYILGGIECILGGIECILGGIGCILRGIECILGESNVF